MRWINSFGQSSVLPSVVLLGAAFLSACTSGPDNSDSTAPRKGELVNQAADPSILGEYADFVVSDYDFGRLPVSDTVSGNTYETDIHGYTVYSPDAPKPMPVVLLLHGRHQTCETELGQAPVFLDDDSCPDLVLVHPAYSYKGYEYLADNLASHGYFVMSIDANDINDNDGSPNNGDAGANARAQLIQAHLDAFRNINNGEASPDSSVDYSALNDALDMSRIGTMGHSRGGDGVSRFIAYNREQAEPHNVVATFALAPTDYNQEFVDGATFATLLPYCDGDVEDVQGAFIYDDSRNLDPDDPTAKFQIVTMGSNHNYFNTVWTSDDWTITDSSGTDSFCGTNSGTDQRDSPEEQRALGLFFMASFFRYFVGQEADFAHYWNGTATVPDFACPGGVGPCEDRHHLSIHSAAADRLIINDFSDASRLSENNLGGAVSADSLNRYEPCDPDRDGVGCPSATTFSITPQLALAWDTDAKLINSFDALDASAYDLISLRVAVSTTNTDKSEPQDFQLLLADASGASEAFNLSDFNASLYHPPGDPESSSGSQKTLLNMVEVPLSAFTGVDLSQLQEVTLLFNQRAAGELQIADLQLMKTSAHPQQ